MPAVSVVKHLILKSYIAKQKCCGSSPGPIGVVGVAFKSRGVTRSQCWMVCSLVILLWLK